MYNGGRRSKAKMHSSQVNYVNLKTVEVGRDRNGYGFTVNGQYPCALGTIMAGSPAEIAGLTRDVCVMAVNGENVTRMGHEQIIKLIGSTEGVLRLTVADAVPMMSDSSDDDYMIQQRKHRTRHQQYRSKSATPTAANRAEMVVAELQRGALFNPYGNQPMYSTMPHATAALDNAKFAPGHLSPFNQTGRPDLHYMQSPQMYADEALQYANMPKQQKPRKSRHGERSQSAVPRNSYYERYDHMGDLNEDRALSPVELSNIMYPSLQSGHPRSRSPLRHPPTMPMMSKPAMMRCVVGYLGSIDIPASANLPTASLQAIRGCVRRLRMEQRVHSLMLMEITSIGVTLINTNRKVTVLYPADRVAFSGVCPDDKRVFGIVTAHNPEDAMDAIEDSDDEPIGSSCHVFFVDPDLCQHNIHAQCAMQFGVDCATDPDTGLCEEFPASSKSILFNVSQLYRDRQHNQQFAEVYGQSPYIGGLGAPNRSNSNSSNSDSGFGNGNGNHDSNLTNGDQRDHVILNVAAHIRNQRSSRGHQNHPAPNSRTSNTMNMSQSPDNPYSMSSNATSPSSTDKSPQSTGMPQQSPSGRLTPRARPDPVGFQSPSLVNKPSTSKQASARQSGSQSASIIQQHKISSTPNINNSAAVNGYHHSSTSSNQRPDNLMFNTTYGGPVMRNKKSSKPPVPARMEASRVKGLPPSGRVSMYATVGPEMLQEAIKEDQTDGGLARFHRQDVRRNSDCSEYSWSHGPKSGNAQKNVRSRKVQHLDPDGREVRM